MSKNVGVCLISTLFVFFAVTAIGILVPFVTAANSKTIPLYSDIGIGTIDNISPIESTIRNPAENIYAQHVINKSWYIDFPFILYQSMIKTPNVVIFASGDNKFWIPTGEKGMQIYLVNMDLWYILHL